MPRVNKGVIQKWAISFSLLHKVDSILSSYSRWPISLGFSVRHYRFKKKISCSQLNYVSHKFEQPEAAVDLKGIFLIQYSI